MLVYSPRTGSFEVVAGRILRENNGSRRPEFVRTNENDSSAVSPLKQRLSDQGQNADNVTDPGLRDLLMSAVPDATHLLDRYRPIPHLTVLKRSAIFASSPDQRSPSSE